MKIEFKKIPLSGIDFEVKQENIKFYGNAKKIDKNLVKSIGTMTGSFEHICDRCGDDFEKIVNQNFEIYASNGIHKEDEYDNLIEFFDAYVNFDTMLQSELESLKCEYLHCKKCSANNNILGE
ncbi:MAG: DNA-binding protein [Sulfurospirillum sp.]